MPILFHNFTRVKPYQSKYLILLFICISALATNAQTNYAPQFKLIDSLTAFIKYDLKLNITDSFYTNKTKIDTGAYFYLYASKTNRVESVIDSGNRDFQFFSNVSKAYEARKKIEDLGYPVIVYKTGGNSTAQLNKLLLSYPDEAIAFIILHEATHQHVRSAPKLISYVYEEALCDAFANWAITQFNQKTSLLNAKAVSQQTANWDNCYHEINTTRQLLEKSNFTDPELYTKSSARINEFVKNANQFQKDRMLYEVNNAYFLRNDAYATHYFEVSSWLNETGDVNKVIEKILNLPRE